MSPTSSGANQPLFPPKQQRPRRWGRPFIGLGLVTLGAVGGGVLWGKHYIEHELSPAISEDLSKSLNRPVQLGPVTHVDLNRIQLGRSTIPAYQPPGRAAPDADSAEIEAVEVRFNLWQALFTRTLDLDVTLVNPQLYLDQNDSGQWLDLNLAPTKPSKSWLKTEPRTIRVQNAQIQLAPYRKKQRQLQMPSGALTLKDSGKTLHLNTEAAIDSGGQATIKGTWQQPEQHLQLTANTNAVEVAPLLELVPDLPIKIRDVQVTGKINIDARPKQPLKLAYQGDLKNVDTTWPTNVLVKAEQLRTDIQVDYEPRRLPKIVGTVRATGATVGIPEDLVLDNQQFQQLRWQQVNGSLKFLPQPQQVRFDLNGPLARGGQLRAKGAALLTLRKRNITWRQVQMLVQARNTPARLLDRAYNLPIAIDQGRIDANLLVKLQQGQKPALGGSARLRNVAGQIKGIPQPFSQADGRLRFQGLTTRFEQVSARYGQIPLRGGGIIDPDNGFNLQAQTAVTDSQTVFDTLGIKSLPFPVNGQVQGQNLRVFGDIKQPVLTGEMVALPGMTLDRVPFRQITADFRLQAPDLSITNIKALPVAGGQLRGQATYDLRPGGQIRGDLVAQNIPGNATAEFYQADPGFKIGPVAAEIDIAGPPEDVETRVTFRAPTGTFPTTGLVVIRNRIARLEDVVAQLPGGPLNINGQIDIAQDQLQANVTLPGTQLAAFDPSLRGILTGEMLLTGPFSRFSTETVQGVGQVRFSQGINLVQDPIVAQVGWNGRQLVVNKATAPNFWAAGHVGVDFKDPAGPQLTTLALDLRAQDFDLETLPPQGPTQISLLGRADLTGKLFGTVAVPNLDAAWSVKQLQVSQFAFESPLRGTIQYQALGGLDLHLAGSRDRIDLKLNAQQQPTAFYIKHQDTLARGVPAGDNLAITLQNFPLQALNLRPAQNWSKGKLSGLVSGEFTADLKTPTLVGTAKIEKPGLGYLLGQSLQGSFSYADGLTQLTDVELVYQTDSRFRLNATINAADNFRTQGKLTVIDQAPLADLLAVWRILELESDPSRSFGQAADVVTPPVGRADDSIWTQLQRLARIEELQQQKQDAQLNAPLPPLEALDGLYAGEIEFSGSQTQGFVGNFDLAVQPLTWGEDYEVQQVLARGQWDNSGITFAPLSITADPSQVTFRGQIGLGQQSGVLTLSQVQLAPLSLILGLPYEVSGALGGEIALAGDLTEPTLDGALSLSDASLNGTPLERANTAFSYRQGQLSFRGEAAFNFNAPQPIVFDGMIPYQWPLSAESPADDRLRVDLTIQDQGLALLNLFNDQIFWENGLGKLTIHAEGPVDRPEVTGMLNVDNATLRATALQDPLTNVRGVVRFEQDTLQVEQPIIGNYGQGQIRIEGGLPIFTAFNPAADPSLRLQLDDLSLNLKALYKGEVNGNLWVMGSAFEPQLGGDLRLSNGQILIAETPAGSTPSPASDALTEDAVTPLRWNDLKVTLAKNVRVAQPPLFSFVATGDVLLNGSINEPRPLGRLDIRKGTVNLFTSRFRLDRRQDNYVCFGVYRNASNRRNGGCLENSDDWAPQIGLDPYLNVAMVTTVTDSVASRLANLNEEAALQASAVGNIESVRVRAQAQGLASELGRDFNRVVELSSSPNRTQNEILALLGGGVSDQLEGGNTELALVNLASSAALTGIGGLFDDVLGSRGSFRVFPVLIPNTDNDARDNRSVLEFGAELGFDVTDKLSVSALQIISDLDQPTLFNVSYDINEQFRVRGAVSLDGEGIGILEYRIRF